MGVSKKNLYTEKIKSNWTEALFIGLALLFFGLLAWRIGIGKQDWLASILLFLAIVFVFYALNYRTLVIEIDEKAFRLKFGVFHWTVPLGSVAECKLDNVPPLQRYGGAGIHFIKVSGRYRASFNFLEYPRVVLELKQKRGLVRDVSFSTRQPDEVIQIVMERSGPHR